MAVMNVDRCFFCCLYGNNEEETIIREIRRDESYEEEMISWSSISGKTMFLPGHRRPIPKMVIWCLKACAGIRALQIRTLPL